MKLNVLGQINGESGYALHVRNLTKAMQEQGCDVALEGPAATEQPWADMAKKDYRRETTLMITTPNAWRFKFPDKAKRLIGFGVFEGSPIPSDWVKVCNDERVSEIWFPSTQTAQDFRDSGVTDKRIAIVPHGVDPKVFNLQAIKDPNVNPEEFNFVFCGGWKDGANDRKGLDIAARAFSEEFGPEEKTRLICKVNMSYQDPASVQRNFESLNLKPKAKRRPVSLILNQMSKEGLAGLFNSCDVIVAPSKAEAFNMPVLEAMACFPYDSEVMIPTGVSKGYITEYFGDLVKIETKSQEIECTLNHPILTDMGWKKAKDINIGNILYLWDDTNEQSMDTPMAKGRIGAFAEERKLQNSQRVSGIIASSKRDSNSTKSRKRQMGSKTGKYQDTEKLYQIYEAQIIRNRSRLFGGNSGWGGNFDYQSISSREFNGSCNPNIEYQNGFAQMGIGALPRQDTGTQVSTAMGMGGQFIQDSSSFEKNQAIPYLEERALWDSDIVYPGSSKQKQPCALQRIRTQLLNQDSRIKQETVKTVKTKHYSGKVYNLKTQSGIYFANSILVHNCGCAPMVTGYGGQLDYTRDKAVPRSYEIDFEMGQATGGPWYDQAQWAYPKVDHLRKLMRQAFEDKDKIREERVMQSKAVLEGWTWGQSAFKALSFLEASV